MKRNLIIIVCFFIGILALMIFGNVIVVGEKIAQITRLWWTEWVFYGLLFGTFAYYVLLPVVRIHRTPPFPVLAVDKTASAVQLKEFGKRLALNCDYIINADKRKQHRKDFERELFDAAANDDQLLEVIEKEIELRKNGDETNGIIGINGQIKEWAKTVFMISAISQNSKFDTISVMWLNYKMIESLVLASGFRPNNRQMFRIYRTVLTTALITYAMSEALMKTSAVRPFDFGDLSDGATDSISDGSLGEEADIDDIDPDDLSFDSQMTDSEGLSVYSILRRIKIPGVVVGSALDGAVNALMTLRIGYITRAYLINGERALTGIQKKREVKFQAMKDSLVTIPEIVASGSAIVGKKTSKFVLKLIKRHYSKKDLEVDKKIV